MDYSFIHQLIDLAHEFEKETDQKPMSIESFKSWIVEKNNHSGICEPEWEGKHNGRSPESVISTLLVHLNRYAKSYSRSAINGSEFSTQEEFIYLINLNAFGSMSKMQLIKRNIQDKPTGMQIINRLIKQNWVEQTLSKTDKRSKEICITTAGKKALDKQMGKIKTATKLVCGDLNNQEKLQLIRLLEKLDHFHNPIYNQQNSPATLLNEATIYYKLKTGISLN